uniref:Uncharacterized protein n=1 Tax=Rhizophora mucronata TaxID=61149 RepID=A0A2P2PQC2_RHIMU
MSLAFTNKHRMMRHHRAMANQCLMIFGFCGCLYIRDGWKLASIFVNHLFHVIFLCYSMTVFQKLI